MRFCVLGSGSRGNATYIESGATRILIDAGFSGREIEQRLARIGVEARDLSGILVTHEHRDHILGVAILSRRYKLPVFINPLTFAGGEKILHKVFACREFESGVTFSFQDLEIHPYSLSHDAADPVGFIVRDGRAAVGLCTDTGAVSRLMGHRLGGCHGLVLECNHDPDLLKQGPYPPALKQRVRSKNGHLANGEAASFLGTILHDGLEHVVLSHISETNNQHEMARQTVENLLHSLPRENGELRLPKISLAWQDQVGELVTISGNGRGC